MPAVLALAEVEAIDPSITALTILPAGTILRRGTVRDAWR